MSLYSLTYLSVATTDSVPESELMDILQASHRNNKPLNITGLLLYRNGYFIQVLEGEQQDVLNLYAKIEQDPRHHHTMVANQEPISKRAFAEWSMGFQNLDDNVPARVEGYTDFLDQPYNPKKITETGNRALTLMNLFRDGAI